ncbi:MAG: serpin family protein, partial [Halobacteriota archaeon]|nr:serpin family protein [Halobacteriota archaeon]
DYPFLDDYFSTVEEYYGGKATNLDFRSDTENSRITINDWVEEKTDGRIKDLIPPGILKPSTRLVLTNTIYFKANWSSQFDTELTREQDFKLDSGGKVKVEMMHKTDSFNYGETGDLQILEMPYKGNDLSMLILLPKEGILSKGGDIDELEDSFSLENIDDWKENMNWELVEVSLPKFKFETKYFMKDDLKEMGMPTAFKYPEADFTGMSPTDELAIDKVIHQTFIEVNEAGTEAAAATAMMNAMGISLSGPKTFTADHPFIFIIQEKETGTILFLGRVSDPSE